MFINSHEKDDGIKELLKENYLIGIEQPLTNGSIILTLISKTTDYITKDSFKVSSDVLKLLQNKRRNDSLYYLESDSTPLIDAVLNDIYLYEIDDPNVRQYGVIEFYEEANRNILKYYVSKDLLRVQEETEFLEKIVDGYLKDKRILRIDNNVIDFKALQDKEIMSYDTDIVLKDNNNYERLLHISGKNICPELMKYIKCIKEEKENLVKKGK